MKFSKALLFPVVMFLFIFNLSACSDNKVPSVTADNESARTEQEGNMSEYSQVLFAVFENTNGTYSIESSNAKDTDKFVITSEDADKYYSLLNFCDYNANEKIILCNKPACSHNTSSCNAYVESQYSVKESNNGTRFSVMDNEGLVFVYDNNLYVLDPFGDLIMMNKDGSDHKTLLSIDSKYSVLNGFLYKDCIYLCVKFLPAFDSSVEQEFSDADYSMAILELNLKTKKCNEKFSFKTELDTTCLGIYENKVYFFYRSPNTLASANTQREVDNEENSHNVSLYYYDLSTSKQEFVIKNIKSHEMDDIAFDKDAVYYHNRKEEKIVKLNLRTGEKHNVLINLGGYIEIYTPINDNKLYFMKDNQLANAFSNELQINEKYCVDLNTGDVNKVNDIN